MLETAVKGMKNKKTRDRFGWNAILLKNWVQEMIKSLAALYNKLEEEKKIS